MSAHQSRAPSRERTRTPPISFSDGDKREIDIDVYGEHLTVDEFEPLVGLYGVFDPADRALGLPPTGGKRIREWLEILLDGQNVLAWHGDVVAGHATLLEIHPGVYELGTFVHRAYQRAGIGSRLVTGLLEQGKRAGVETVRLVVGRTHRTAITLYRKAGFEPIHPPGIALEMVKEL